MTRTPPVPTSISQQAQDFLRAMGEAGPRSPYPPLDDLPAWRTHVAQIDALMASMGWEERYGHLAEIAACKLGEAAAFQITPTDYDPSSSRILLDIHGGALIAGGGELAAQMSRAQAVGLMALTYSVDYPMPPDHPYPAALDACLSAYRHILDRHDPAHVIVQGASAGGNLAAALMLRIADAGLPFPAGLILLSPETDLTESGDSIRANQDVDVMLWSSLMPANRLYAGGHDLSDPYISPLFADIMPGWPPTIQTSGTRDLFLSNVVRMHARLQSAGVRSQIVIGEAMPHGGFGGTTPEDREMTRQVRAFADEIWRMAR